MSTIMCEFCVYNLHVYIQTRLDILSISINSSFGHYYFDILIKGKPYIYSNIIVNVISFFRQINIQKMFGPYVDCFFFLLKIQIQRLDLTEYQ